MLFDKLKKLKKPDPEKEQKLRDEIEEMGGLDKKDVPALLLSAFLVILPVVVVVLGLFCLLAFLFFA